jgi:hypothetical protein
MFAVQYTVIVLNLWKLVLCCCYKQGKRYNSLATVRGRGYGAPLMATSEGLTESDIPGAILEEPLEKATVHALKWWLLCRGIKAPSSWRKAKLIER